MTVPEYLGVWCPTCREDCLPLLDGRCGFCDTKVVNPETDEPVRNLEADLAAQLPERQEEPVVDTCKIAGCDRPVHDRRGMYGSLCVDHKAEKRAKRQAKQAAPRKIVRPIPKPTPAATANGSYVDKIARLNDLAERLDALRAETELAETMWRKAVEELA